MVMALSGPATVRGKRGRALVGLALSVAFATAGAAPVAAAAASAVAPGPGVRGVWMGMVTTVTGFNQPMSAGRLQPRWRVFLDQGVLLTQLPSDGLAGLDLAARAAGRATDPHWHQHTEDGHG